MLGLFFRTAALGGMLAVSTAAWAAAPAGEVLALKGACVAERDGKPMPLKAGDPVLVGDTVVVPDDGRLKLRMVDGSVISEAAGSRMTIGSYAAGGSGGGRDVGLKLASGLLRAVVAPAGQPSRFEVETATGVAAVRSTDWFVSAKTAGTQVGVLDGVVALTSAATHRAVSIPARWGSRVEPGRDPVPPRVWTKAEFDDVIGRTDLN